MLTTRLRMYILYPLFSIVCAADECLSVSEFSGAAHNKSLKKVGIRYTCSRRVANKYVPIYYKLNVLYLKKELPHQRYF